MTVIIWAQASDGVIIASDGRRTRDGKAGESNELVCNAVIKVRWRQEPSPLGGDSVLIWGSLGRGEIDREDVHSLIEEHVDSGAPSTSSWDELQMIKSLQGHVYEWNEKEVCTCGPHCPDVDKCNLPDEAAGIGRNDFFNPGGSDTWCRCRAYAEEPLTLITQKFSNGVASPLVVKRVSRTGHIEDVFADDNVAIFGSLTPASRAKEQAMKLNECARLPLGELRPKVESILATAYYESAEFSHHIGMCLPNYKVPWVGGLARFVTVRTKDGQALVSEDTEESDTVKTWPIWLHSGLGQWKEFDS